MSKSKFDTVVFQEGGAGSISDIVGKKSLFVNKFEFLEWLINECEEIEEGYEELKLNLNVEDVEERYVRYFPHFGEDSGFEIESGYTFCNKGKGAFEVYTISFQ